MAKTTAAAGCLLLLGVASILLAAQPAQAGLLPCFPSIVDIIANKFAVEKAAVFKVLKSDGTPFKVLKPSLCPGMTYTMHVEFPDPRTYWVTATKGFFNGLLPSLACPNQFTNNQSSAVTTIDLPFTLSCNIKGFSVWGIASQAKNDLLYKFMNVTLPVLDLSACPKSFCAANTTAGAPIVVPSGNSTLAAYGQCGGAGGECAKWGFCDDRPFPAYSCLSGWSCQRQHRWYYQCLPATGLIPSATGCDFSAFGEPLATMMSGLGMICTLKSGLMSFALNPLAVPKMIDPFAMLQVFNGLAVMKSSALTIDPVSLLTSFKDLCAFVPNSNSTQAVMVAGMSKFLTIFTSKLMPASGNSTDISKAALDVLASMGAAAYSGSYTDLTKSFNMNSMLSMVTSFGTVLTMVKQFNLL